VCEVALIVVCPFSEFKDNTPLLITLEIEIKYVREPSHFKLCSLEGRRTVDP
jgi:hypothetical protein